MIQAVSVILVCLLNFFNIPLVSSLWLLCKRSSWFNLSGCIAFIPFMGLLFFLMMPTSVHAGTVPFLIEFTTLCLLRLILLIGVFCTINMDKNERDSLEIIIIPLMSLRKLKLRQILTFLKSPRTEPSSH